MPNSISASPERGLLCLSSLLMPCGADDWWNTHATVATVKAGRAVQHVVSQPGQYLAPPCDPFQGGGSPFPGLLSQGGEGRQKQHKGASGSWSLRSQQDRHTHR